MDVVVTSDVILEYLKGLVESKHPIAREVWLDAAFKLNLLRIDEAQLYNKMHQEVAKRKIELKTVRQGGSSLKEKSVAQIEMEVEAEDIFRFMKDQEDKIYSVDEFIRLAKKSADISL